MDDTDAQLLEQYAYDRGVRSAELAVYHAVAVDNEREEMRRAFIRLLASGGSRRGQVGVWFGLLTLAHMSVIVLHSGNGMSRAHLETLALEPGAADLRDTMVEMGRIEDVTAKLVQDDIGMQILDLYDLAVATVGAVFRNFCRSGSVSERWELFAQLSARKDRDGPSESEPE